MYRLLRTLSTLAVLTTSAVALGPCVALAQSQTQAMEDVVYLKDGSIFRGVITEQRPGVSILIRTRDGNTLRFAMNLIDRMTKEPIAGTSLSDGIQQPRAISLKKPGTAFLISLFVVGGGQVYNGQYGKAAVMFSGAGLGSFMALSSLGEGPCPSDPDRWCGNSGSSTAKWGFIVFLGFWAWSLADAPSSASAINRRAQGISFKPELHPLKLGSGETRLGVSFLSFRH